MTLQSTIDLSVLTRRAQELVQTGRPAAARPILSALRRLTPDSARVVELEARLLLAEGLLSEAITTLNRGIEGAPEDAALLLCRAEAKMRAGAFAPAAQDAAGAVLLEPGGTKAKAILGLLLIELGQLGDADLCLAEAVRAEPNCVAYRQGLGEAQERQGDIVAARATMAEGIRRAPSSVALRTAAIMISMRQREFGDAATLAEAARRAGLADASVFGLLGHALSNLGRHEEAAEAYADAAKLAPEDAYVQHLVRAAGILPSAVRAPAGYVEVLFDGYAERFETHLLGLGYRIPGLMRAALLAQIDVPLVDQPGAQAVGPVLDLGCGTGLLGVVMSDLKLDPLIGVDLSGQMLDRAADKGVYHELLKIDLESVLADPTRRWRIILAADVLCYFGELAGVFVAAHDRLQQNGLFILTVEAMGAREAGQSGAAWRLRSQGRYGHTQGYVERSALAAGFEILESREELLRLEADAPVEGFLLVLRRSAPHD